jgi:hypothetical protein
MTRNRKTLSIVTKAIELEGQIAEVLDLLNVADLDKAKGRIGKLYRTIEDKDNTLKELCELLGVTHVGNAKNKINGMLRKVNERNIAEVYNLDYSFLQRNSKAWTMTIKGQDDPKKVIQQWEKNAECDRKMCFTAYLTGLEAAERAALEEGYEGVEVAQVVEGWHEQMKERYDELSAPEFWLEFKGSVIGINIERSDKPPVMFAEAIRMVQEFSYSTLCQQLIASNKVIGTIPRSQFAAEIVGKAVHRMVHGGGSLPTSTEESKLFALLAPTEVNPYLNEFMLDSNTELAEVMAHYQQLTGEF